MRTSDHKLAIRQIAAALKGPVADIFRKLVPSLADLSGPQLYDAVISSADLLHGCMLIFRRRREAFAELLVDSKGRLVNDDFVALRCGRTVHDIIAMVVRTHAKQHLRTTLGGDPSDVKSPAGRMYQALNEYLIHEWQLPLIRHYTPLPVATVRDLGPRIMDYRNADSLRELAGETPAAKPDRIIAAPAAVPVSPLVATATPPRPTVVAAAPLPIERPDLGTNSRERDFWWETVNDPMVRATLGNMTNSDLREMTAAFCQLGEGTRNNLLAPMGLSLYQAAVVLGTCYRGLGRAAFSQLFGQPGNPGTIAAFTATLQRKGAGSRSQLRQLEQFTKGVLAAMPRNAAKPAMALAG